MVSDEVSKCDRVFHKKNRKGGVVQIVREHYLRTDISCGSERCTQCGNNSRDLPSDVRQLTIPDPTALCDYVELLETPEWRGIVFLQTAMEKLLSIGHSRDHGRVLDIVADRRRGCRYFANEHFAPTYVGQTSLTLSADDREKNATLAAAAWYDDHLRDTNVHVTVLSDIISADDGAALGLEVLSMGAFIERHFGDRRDLTELHESIRVSVDAKTRVFAAENTNNSSVEEGGATVASAVMGRVAVGGRVPSSYPAHAAEDALLAGVQSAVYAMGVLHVPRGRSLDIAFVRQRGVGNNAVETVPDIRDADALLDAAPANVPREILLCGMASRNRAIHGDLVVVEVFPRAQWQSPSASVVVTNAEEDVGGVLDADSGLRGRTSAGVIPTGKVVGVLRRNWRDYVCTLSEEDERLVSSGSSSGNIARVLCIPMDSRVPRIRVATRNADRLSGVRFIVRIDRWDASQSHPDGHAVRSLGCLGAVDTEIAAILVENGLQPNPTYSAKQLAELPSPNWCAGPCCDDGDATTRRRDFRGSEHLVFSIDPLGSKDVDDALSVRRLADGRVELAVHIADVSHFVRASSSNDFEARDRSTTLYLADRRYDMLPPLLSEDLCSLLGGQDRYAFSVVWTMRETEVDAPASASGGIGGGRVKAYNVEDVWYGRTVVRSAYQMHYELAQEIHDRSKTDAEFLTLLRQLKGGMESARSLSAVSAVRAAVGLFMDIARHFRRQRVANGALELYSTEVRFKLAAADTSKSAEPTVVELIAKKELEIHSTVAECMVLANHWVARRIADAFPDRALLRYHPPPRPEDFAELVELAKERGFVLDTRSNRALARSLDAVASSSDDVEVGRFFRSMATAAMSEAAYFSTGDVESADAFFHYGLALGHYTHFTSPIRRYADILVHRQLAAAIGVSSVDDIPSRRDLPRIARHINMRHRASKLAQEDSTLLYQCIYFRQAAAADTRGVITDAIVRRTRSDGFVAFAPGLCVEAPVVLRTKGGPLDIPGGMFSQGGQTLLGKKCESTDADGCVRGSVSRDGDDVVALAVSVPGLPDVNPPRELRFRLFDRVRVSVVLVTSRAHRDKIRFRLVGWADGSGGSASAGHARREGSSGVAQNSAVALALDAMSEGALRATESASKKGTHSGCARALANPYAQSADDATLYHLVERMKLMAVEDDNTHVDL